MRERKRERKTVNPSCRYLHEYSTEYPNGASRVYYIANFFFFLFLRARNDVDHARERVGLLPSFLFALIRKIPSPLAVESGQRIHQFLLSLLYQAQLREILDSKPVPFHATTKFARSSPAPLPRVQWHSPHLGHIVRAFFSSEDAYIREDKRCT